MTRVLLITDTERVLRIFGSLETREDLQLRRASTLDQADQEIAEKIPDLTFVQSRVSGFSGEIQLRHLRKMLPKGAKIILLAGDAAEVGKDHAPVIDLTLDDGEFEESVSKILRARRGTALEKGATGEVPPAKVKAPGPALSSQGTTAPRPSEVILSPPPMPEPPAYLPVVGGDRTRPFAEMMELGMAGAKVAPGLPEDPDQSGGFSLPEASDPLLEGYLRGISLADAMANAEKEKRRYRWLLPLILAFLLIPLLSYLAGQKAPIEPSRAPTRLPYRVPRRVNALVQPLRGGAVQASNSPLSGALFTALNTLPPMPQVLLPVIHPVVIPTAKSVAAPAAKLAAIPAAKPAKIPEAAPAKIPEAKPAKIPEAKPVEKTGLKSLPSVVASATLDGGYGKTHPGWQRYFDKQAEYTLFKEGNLFRAMQVVALGKEDVPKQLFNRLLQEFAGTKRFQLQASLDKGDYLLERGVAKGGVSLTVYRRKKDLKVKGLVLYYQ
jgi:CheY-like chemotaxis protein